ncbi:MAG: hypothetical protein EBZ47_09885, partial [Chlamydiae bacterium]|nr:hypothetical protein [Chlamydiota bacterium]
EEQEIVSSLKKFDFLYQASPEEKYISKWNKIAGEIEDALLKLSNGKEVLLKVAEKRGGEVYVARCPLMFPKLFGEKKRKIEAPEKTETSKKSKTTDKTETPKKTEKKVAPVKSEPKKNKAKIAVETSDSEFDSDISYHSSDYESCSESESECDSDCSCCSDSESESESESDSDSESDSESETDIEQEAWEDLARIDRLRIKWEKRKIYAKEYNTSLKAIITRLSKVKDDIEEKDLKKAVTKYINAYRKK